MFGVIVDIAILITSILLTPRHINPARRRLIPALSVKCFILSLGLNLVDTTCALRDWPLPGVVNDITTRQERQYQQPRQDPD